MLKRLIFCTLLLGSVAQVIPVQAEKTVISISLENIVKKGKEVGNYIDSLSDQTKILGILGLLGIGAVGFGLYALHQITEFYNQRARWFAFHPQQSDNELNSNMHPERPTLDLSQENFEHCREILSEPLRSFLDDFATWSQKEKNTIQFDWDTEKSYDLPKIRISGLSAERQALYMKYSCLARWLERQLYDMANPRINGKPLEGIPFIPPYMNYRSFFHNLQTCIEYLRQ